MEHGITRRGFIWAAAATATSARFLRAQPAPAAAAPAQPSAAPVSKSAVSIVSGDSRRNNIRDSLIAIEDQIMPILKTRKRVVIKPNIVNTGNQLASTHVDSLQGILDFLAPRFKGPVVIAESSAGWSTEGYDNFKYNLAVTDHKPMDVSLVDLNEEGRYETHTILDGDLHAVPVRLAARLLDPEAFVICSAILKTHNTVIATLSLKNMALGAPLHSARGQTPRFNDKRIYHGGVRQTHLDIWLTTKILRPSFGATVIDGFSGMEGNGPNDGTPVPSKIAIASTDYVAADRVGVEAMGIDAKSIGYLQFCGQDRLGNSDLANIDLRGAKLADVTRKYKMHGDIEKELRWQGPMKEVPEKLG